MAIAFNTIAYDVSTAERYMGEADFMLEQADALDSINVAGIHDPEIKDALVNLSRKAAMWIRSGKKPNEQKMMKSEYFTMYSTPLETLCLRLTCLMMSSILLR